VRTASATIELAPPHLEVLQKAAIQSQLTLRAYIREVLEAHAAALLLPSVPSSGGRPGGEVGAVGASGEREESFPWPVEVYSLHLPKAEA
jgi:hypothetical protein